MGTAKVPTLLSSRPSFCNIGPQFIAPKSGARRAFSSRPLTQMETGGLDSDGRTFKTAEEMWREEVGDGDPQKKFQWYNKGINYWQVRDPSFSENSYKLLVVAFSFDFDLLVCEGRGSYSGWSAGWIWACEYA